MAHLTQGSAILGTTIQTTTVDAAGGLTQGVNEALSRLIHVESNLESFFESNGFIGKEKDSTKLIWKKTELDKGRGEDIYLYMRAKLDRTAGIPADGILEGQEAFLDYGYQTLRINQLRNAVALDGAMTEKRTIFDLRMDAKDALKVWLQERSDKDIFDALASSCTRNVYPGAATSTATLSTIDVLDLKTIAKARAIAKKNRVKGIRHKGSEYYVLIMSPDQMYDLQADVANAGFSWEDLHKDANNRGEGNPLFTGALGLYMGVILYMHENIATSTIYGAGGDVPGAQALFLGAGAGLLAYGGYVQTGAPTKAVEKMFDYDNVWATALGVIKGVAKTLFLLSGISDPTRPFNEDFAVFGIETARSNLAES